MARDGLEQSGYRQTDGHYYLFKGTFQKVNAKNIWNFPYVGKQLFLKSLK